MFKDKDVRKGILSSIIASLIFLIFFQPILTFMWSIIVAYSSQTYSGYVDKVYGNAALGKRNWIDFLVLTFFLYLLFLLIFKFLLRFRLEMGDYAREMKMKLMSEEEKKNFINRRATALSKRLYLIKRHSKKFIICTYVFQILFILLMADTIFTAYVDLQLNTSFSQRCTVINPYIDNHEQEILQSKWASMKSRKDYEFVNQYLENLAKSQNIILPEPLLK